MRTTCSFHQGPFLLTESAAQYLQLKAYQVFFFANGTAFIQKAYLLHLFGNVSVLQAFFFFLLEFLCIVLTVLELALLTRLASNSTCLPCVNS